MACYVYIKYNQGVCAHDCMTVIISITVKILFREYDEMLSTIMLFMIV